METSSEADTCVWIKEELESEDEDETIDPFFCENDDPLCEVPPALGECDRDEASNEEILINEVVQNIIKNENIGLPLQPIVDLRSNDDDPELNLNEITADGNLADWSSQNEKEPLDSSDRVVDMPYQCSECYFSCFQHANFVEHMRIHAVDNPHVCTMCNKSFFFKNSHIRHMKIHQHEEVYDALKNALNDTKKDDDDDDGGGGGGGGNSCEKEKTKEFTCAACNATFMTRRLLLGHIRRHTHVEQYQCLVCNMRFEQKVQLLRHEKTHAEEMPFVCNVCDSRFGDKFALAQHAITHTYDMSYVCRVCNRRFWQKERLDEHTTTYHDEKKRFECDVCHYKYARLKDLRNHKRSHASHALAAATTTTHECPLCTFHTKSVRVLARHAKGHLSEPGNVRPYACPLCKKKSVGKREIIAHLESHVVKDKSKDGG